MKNVKNRLLFLLSFLFVGSSLVSTAKQSDKISVKGICTEITFYSPTTVRILKYPQGQIPQKESLVVLQKPEKVKLTQDKSADYYSIKSNEINVSVNTNTGEIIFKDSKGNLLLKDKNTQFSFRKDMNKDSYQVKQIFNLDTNEAIYGLGQIQNGQLNQRNQKELLRQRNTVICIPFFQSIKGYGVYLDNYSPTRFSDSPEETVFDSDLGTCSDYYFMYGKNTDGVVKAMRQLTGKVPMLPESGFGFWQSRERYV
ncbi:MAG: xylosidase, partial [Coprobacter sp.]